LFVRVVGPSTPDDLPLVMDWEVHEGQTATEIQNGLTFLQTVQSLSGRKPMVYCGYYFMSDLAFPSWLSNYYLWLAAYDSNPKIPPPWSKYDFWQYTDQGSVAGVTGKCDLSVAVTLDLA
jgi:lysozyme